MIAALFAIQGMYRAFRPTRQTSPVRYTTLGDDDDTDSEGGNQ